MYIGRLWGGGVGGGVSKCFHPQLISSFRQTQESTDAPRMCIYIYVCVSRSCLADAALT